MTRKELKKVEKLSKDMSELLIRMARHTVTILAKAPDGMPYCNTGTVSNPTERFALQAYEDHDTFIAIYHQLSDIINAEQDELMQEILVSRYVELLSWRKVANKLKITKSYAMRYFWKRVY